MSKDLLSIVFSQHSRFAKSRCGKYINACIQLVSGCGLGGQVWKKVVSTSGNGVVVRKQDCNVLDGMFGNVWVGLSPHPLYLFFF